MDETNGSVRCGGSFAFVGSSTRVAAVETSTNLVRRIGAWPVISVSIPTFVTSIDIEPS